MALYCVPSMSLDKLQRCQNMLARVVTQSCSKTSAKPLLQSLHWLPIRERIRHKVATLTFKAHRMSSPPYLSSGNLGTAVMTSDNFTAERSHPVTDAQTFQHAAPDRAENAH